MRCVRLVAGISLIGFVGCGGLICADTFADFETSGLIVSSAGDPIEGATVIGELLSGGQPLTLMAGYGWSASDGSFSTQSSAITGKCAGAPYILHRSDYDVTYPDAVQIRVQRGRCVREVEVQIPRENILDEFPLIRVQLPDVVIVADCP